eukprot:m.74981 g.74981  ORF g.74981 m.74981 type:complete len:288 (-) comp13960_c0_seq1:109-972(-)
MVVLSVKRGDDALFLYETSTQYLVDDITNEVADLYNTQLRIDRLCMAMEQLAEHGIMKPPKMQGLTPDQVIELKLKDDTDRYYPSGGAQDIPDDIGRRTGKAPSVAMQEVLRRTISEAKAVISKEQVKRNVLLTKQVLQDTIDKLKGAVMIVYPMGLPNYEEVQIILDDDEDLTGTQAAKQVIPQEEARLWWANKELTRSKKLMDFIGKNEKTKIVCKIQRKGQGAPAREPLYDEDAQKSMMVYAYKKQEEWKKLEDADEDDFLNSAWADSLSLKRQLQGTGNIRLK